MATPAAVAPVTNVYAYINVDEYEQTADGYVYTAYTSEGDVIELVSKSKLETSGIYTFNDDLTVAKTDPEAGFTEVKVTALTGELVNLGKGYKEIGTVIEVAGELKAGASVITYTTEESDKMNIIDVIWVVKAAE